MDDNPHVISQNGTGFLPEVKSSEIALQTLGKPANEPITPGNQVKGQTAGRRWRRAWYGYCQDTTLHGLKQITEHNSSLFRRLLWLGFVLAGAGLFLYQMITGIMYYYSWPIAVNVKINYNESMAYPAVTLCNQNTFRSTVAAERKLYDVLSRTFSARREDSHVGNHSQSNPEDTISLTELFAIMAHQKEDFVVGCEFAGTKCTAADFEVHPTEFGTCYTFNGEDSGRRVHKRGFKGGLQLELNVEQYEYMPGPNDGAGIKVLVHHPKEAPLMEEFGMAVPPGTHAYIGITMVEVTNLPHPHGNCSSRTLDHYDYYTKLNCLTNCKEQFLKEKCRCRDIYMEDRGVYPSCNLLDTHGCLVEAKDEFESFRGTCDCPTPCRTHTYEMAGSFSYISDYDSQKLLYSELTDKLQGPFLYAKEVEQRVNNDIVGEDTKLIGQVAGMFSAVDDALNRIKAGVLSARQSIFERFLVMEERLNFHHIKGLQKVLYITEHDFVRGWVILEERTMPYVCFDYMNVDSAFRRTLQGLNATNEKTEASLEERAVDRAEWAVLKTSFLGRLDALVRARANISEVHRAYKTGSILVNYKASKDQRYDLSYVSRELLQAIVDDDIYNQDHFYNEIQRLLDTVEKSIFTYIEIAENASQFGEIDEGLLKENNAEFVYGCKYYNYNIYRFKTRIVYAPVEIMETRIDDFMRQNRTLFTAMGTFDMESENALNSLNKFNSTTWNFVKGVVSLAETYLIDHNTSKAELAHIVTSYKAKEMANIMSIFLEDLRYKGGQLLEELNYLRLELQNTWKNMLSEYPTYGFYQKVHEDFLAWKNGSDPFYLPYFADLLDVDVESLSNATAQDLEYRLNADFASLDMAEVLNQVRRTCSRLLPLSQCQQTLGLVMKNWKKHGN